MSIFKWLIQKGGKLYFNHSKPEIKRKTSLLEKTLANLKFLEKEDLYISSLSENELKNSNCTSEDIPFVLEKIKNYFSIPSFVLLWEGRSSSASIKGVFYSEKDKLIDKIKNAYNGSYKEKGGIFLTKNRNLFLAEKELISLIWKK